MAAAALTSNEVEAHMQAFWAERLTAATVVVERAVERGELSPGAEPTLILQCLVGPLWLRVLLTGEDLEPDLPERLAKLVVGGLAPASLRG